MKTTNMEIILTETLKSTELPPPELIQKIKSSITSANPDTEPKSSKRLSKILIVAAALCLIAGGTVLAVNNFRLQDQVIPGTERVWYTRGSEEHREERVSQAIVIQGLPGSPEHAAHSEWEEYFRTYGIPILFDRMALNLNNEDFDDIPEEYRRYPLLTFEMVDVMLDIVERHGLSLMGEELRFGLEWELYDREKQEEQHIIYLSALLASIAYGPLFTDDSIFDSGTQWDCGTFYLYCSYRGNNFTFLHTRKGVFNCLSGSIGNIDEYTVWEYTNKHGSELVLAQDDDVSIIFLDTETAFIVIYLDADTGRRERHPLAYTPPDFEPMTPAAFEAFADSIDFTQLK